MEETYDCTNDVREHQYAVIAQLQRVIDELTVRGQRHDQSKLLPPEKELFDKWTPELKQRTFGTDYYKQALDGMGEGIQHHYRANRHHPEHYANGVNGMTLVDLVEMFCDWVAAAEARSAPVDLVNGRIRFDLSPQLVEIFSNTLREMKS